MARHATYTDDFMNAHRPRSAVVVLLAAVGLSSCGGDGHRHLTAPPVPDAPSLAKAPKREGAIVVQTTTTGASLDPDGYTVTVSGEPSKTISDSGSIRFARVSAGTGTVTLSGIAANCAAASNPQSYTLAAGATDTITFSVTCQAVATTGNITVMTETTGANLDSDGYLVTVDANAGTAQPIGINDAVTFSSVSAGSHTVALSGIAPNCFTNSTQTLTVIAGQTVQATFSVTCTSTIATEYTLVGAADVTDCHSPDAEATADVLDRVVASDPNATVFVAGDMVHDSSSAADYTNCYGPTWGRHKARTYVAMGNHQYPNPNPTWDYFGNRAGPRGLGYYSFDLGEYWHVIVLNDNADIGGPAYAAGSAQDQWLQADLAANLKPCTIAIWHRPYVASDDWLSNSRKIFWDRLYAAGAEIVLNGHLHTYEREAPQTPALVRDDARGIRQFIVGTGGVSTYTFDVLRPNAVVNSASRGVLKLTLGPRTYKWEFLWAAGQSFTDSGSGTCH